MAFPDYNSLYNSTQFHRTNIGLIEQIVKKNTDLANELNKHKKNILSNIDQKQESWFFYKLCIIWRIVHSPDFMDLLPPGDDRREDKRDGRKQQRSPTDFPAIELPNPIQPITPSQDTIPLHADILPGDELAEAGPSHRKRTSPSPVSTGSKRRFIDVDGEIKKKEREMADLYALREKQRKI